MNTSKSSLLVRSLLLGVVGGLGVTAGHAQTIIDNGTTAGAGTNVDLDTHYAFVGYPAANASTPVSPGAAITSVGNVANFSPLTFTSGGSGDDSALHTTTAVNAQSDPYSNSPGFTYGSTLSATSTVTLASETYDIYTSAYYAGSQFTFTLSNVNGTVGTPLTVTDYFPYTDISHSYGVESITVTGAVGDTLTFADSAVKYVIPVGQPSAGSYGPGNIGFNAITADIGPTPIETPEPSTWALVLGGLGSLIAFQRTRQRLV